MSALRRFAINAAVPVLVCAYIALFGLILVRCVGPAGVAQ